MSLALTRMAPQTHRAAMLTGLGIAVLTFIPASGLLVEVSAACLLSATLPFPLVSFACILAYLHGLQLFGGGIFMQLLQIRSCPFPCAAA